MRTTEESQVGPRIVLVNDRHAALHPAREEPVDYAEVDGIIGKYRDLRPSEALVLILQDVQRTYRYIPEPVMRLVSERLALPMVQIYGVASFYQDFSMEPRARHQINVCEGTSCYVRGADRVRRAIQDRLGIDYDETTADRAFGVARADYCYGCCQLGPVAEVNHRFYPHMTPEKVVALIDEFAAGGAASGHPTPEGAVGSPLFPQPDRYEVEREPTTGARTAIRYEDKRQGT